MLALFVVGLLTSVLGACGFVPPAPSEASTLQVKRTASRGISIELIGDRWIVFARTRPALLYYPNCHGGMTSNQVTWHVLEFSDEQGRTTAFANNELERAHATYVLDLAWSPTAHLGAVTGVGDDIPTCSDYTRTESEMAVLVARLPRDIQNLTGANPPLSLLWVANAAWKRMQFPLDSLGRTEATPGSGGGYLIAKLNAEVYAFVCSLGFLNLTIPGAAETAVTSAHCVVGDENHDLRMGAGSVLDGDSTAVSWVVANPYDNGDGFSDVAILASRQALQQPHQKFGWPSDHTQPMQPFQTVAYGRPATGSPTQWRPDRVEWYSDIVQVYKDPSGVVTVGDSGAVLSDASNIAWAVTSKATHIVPKGDPLPGSVWTSLTYNRWMAAYAESLIADARWYRGQTTIYLHGAAPPITRFGEATGTHSQAPYPTGTRLVDFGNLQVSVLPWVVGSCQTTEEIVDCGLRSIYLTGDDSSPPVTVNLRAQWKYPYPPNIRDFLPMFDSTAFSVHLDGGSEIPTCPQALLSCKEVHAQDPNCPCNYDDIQGASAAIIRLLAQYLGQKVEDLPSDKRSDLDNLIRSVR